MCVALNYYLKTIAGASQQDYQITVR